MPRLLSFKCFRSCTEWSFETDVNYWSIWSFEPDMKQWLMLSGILNALINHFYEFQFEFHNIGSHIVLPKKYLFDFCKSSTSALSLYCRPTETIRTHLHTLYIRSAARKLFLTTRQACFVGFENVAICIIQINIRNSAKKYRFALYILIIIIEISLAI